MNQLKCVPTQKTNAKMYLNDTSLKSLKKNVEEVKLFRIHYINLYKFKYFSNN